MTARVIVEGRPGAGRRTVATALRRRGVHVVTSEPDVRIRVVAEAHKPEDGCADAVPTVFVQTKADLTETVLPGIRVVGLLAVVGPLTDDEVAALRVLTRHPAEMSSVDAFVSCAHPLTREVRQRLLERLDRFGIAHAVLALGDGAEPAAVAERLAELSNIDAVLPAIRAAGAPLRYRRMCGEKPCATSDDDVLERMTAAVDVIEGAGAVVDRGDRPDDHRRRALYWSRYGRGPVTELHRACAVDIVRGSLRLLDGARR